METTQGRTVKGLSIAIVALAAIGIVSAIVVIMLSGILFVFVTDLASDLEFEIVQSAAESEWAIATNVLAESLSSTVGPALAEMILGIFVVLMFVYIASCVLSLITGILGIKRGKQHDRLGVVIGMSIASAIVSFLIGNFILTILHIIAAVFSSKAKNSPTPIGYQAGYYQNGQATQQFGGYQPEQPIYQPDATCYDAQAPTRQFDAQPLQQQAAKPYVIEQQSAPENDQPLQ